MLVNSIGLHGTNMRDTLYVESQRQFQALGNSSWCEQAPEPESQWHLLQILPEAHSWDTER